MRMLLGFGVGAAVGYVLGAKAGQERYEELKQAAGRVSEHPTAQAASAFVHDQADKVEATVREKLGEVQDSTGSGPDVPPEPDTGSHTQSEELDHVGTAIGESIGESIEGNEGDMAKIQHLAGP